MTRIVLPKDQNISAGDELFPFHPILSYTYRYAQKSNQSSDRKKTKCDQIIDSSSCSQQKHHDDNHACSTCFSTRRYIMIKNVIYVVQHEACINLIWPEGNFRYGKMCISVCISPFASEQNNRTEREREDNNQKKRAKNKECRKRDRRTEWVDRKKKRHKDWKLETEEVRTDTSDMCSGWFLWKGWEEREEERESIKTWRGTWKMNTSWILLDRVSCCETRSVLVRV